MHFGQLFCPSGSLVEGIFIGPAVNISQLLGFEVSRSICRTVRGLPNWPMNWPNKWSSDCFQLSFLSLWFGENANSKFILTTQQKHMLGKKLEFVLRIIVIQMIGFLILLQLNSIGMFQNVFESGKTLVPIVTSIFETWKSMLGQCKAFIKSEIGMIPFLGWAMWFNEFGFLTRAKASKDLKTLQRASEHFRGES